MTSLNHPDSIRHFQSLCDACQELITRRHSVSELRLYADGYIHALRRSEKLNPREQEKFESLVDRWILDPSSFVGVDGDMRNLFVKKEKKW
ncbi:DUF6761 family protein [Prochlorococcus sp. MIT 1341]|uniref:DUF6761 family protein n=1 Tax=Prochlorococcus sp. MIT 1341 TaxID=3096221 RepID=UPI002A747BE5|nr:DUF6761 family protein [Prochlorococcus sp. MIT 1341]